MLVIYNIIRLMRVTIEEQVVYSWGSSPSAVFASSFQGESSVNKQLNDPELSVTSVYNCRDFVFI